METKTSKARRLAAQERILRENENPSTTDADAFKQFAPLLGNRYSGIDINKHTYLTMPRTLLEYRTKLKVSPLQILVVMYIHNHKSYKSVWMDYNYIAQGIGIDDKWTVRQAIRDLRIKDLVVVTEHPESAVSHLGNRYDFTPLWLACERLRLAEENDE